MIKYIRDWILTEWRLWRAELKLKRLVKLADHYSKHYNNQKVVIYKDPYGSNIVYDDNHTLIYNVKGHVMCNRNGFILLRRRGKFSNKHLSWTGLQSIAVYISTGNKSK